ncbi:MAG: hypothetical protein JJ863_35505 [Deltaproteobacteria bacterium]|nr:hypothetical protein [Deltaproteobacteria bacterium]
MGRSAVLTGRIDARDRAKLRGRLDADLVPSIDPHAELDAWLKAAGYGSERAAIAVRMDLDDYLGRTAHIDVPAQERLRRLAIELEFDYGFAPEVVDRVYLAAIRIDPNDYLLWHSRGISMKYAARLGDGEKWERMAAKAWRWLLRAWELEQSDPQVPYSLGLWHYYFGSKEEAEQWLEHTLELRPDHGFARLYRAYCLHDRERWSEALAAYEAVPLQTFQGHQDWRLDVILEGQAYCKLRTGDRSGATADFGRLLERWEREPLRMRGLFMRLTKEACEGPLCEELGDAFRRVAELDT